MRDSSFSGRTGELTEAMLCTFCGTENRPENKFCGMCGVRLERRKEQRRARQTASVKCQTCGHINDVGMKFCGLCGVRVDRRVLERRTLAPGPRATAIANVQLPTPDLPGSTSSVAGIDPLTPPAADEIEARQAAAAIFRSQPSPRTTIGGPSFLGLGNDPANDNSDYLLDDERTSGSVGKIVLFVAVILIGGLSYMGWRSGFFTRIQATSAKTKTVPQPTPMASPSPGSPDQAGVNAAVPDLAPPPTDRSSIPPLPGDAKNTEPSAAAGAGQDDSSADPGAASASADKAKAPKDMPTPPRRRPSATLIQAQNYLQGRGGVRQNCEQGLIYLKAATQKNDPAAAVQMGALYASGHCVQQDRVMAYRWFNSAHELDPANPWIQTNLDQLWVQMTSQERRQVAR
jgi:hypothetical protein